MSVCNVSIQSRGLQAQRKNKLKRKCWRQVEKQQSKKSKTNEKHTVHSSRKKLCCYCVHIYTEEKTSLTISRGNRVK